MSARMDVTVATSGWSGIPELSEVRLFLDTSLTVTLRRMLERLDRAIPDGTTVRVIIAGGIAVHLYTGERATIDVDAEFSHRVHLPPDTETLALEPPLFWDRAYNPAFGLLHEDYIDDSIPIGMNFEHLDVRVLSPLDLAVSKIARFGDADRRDIVALARAGLVTAEDLKRRAREAARDCLGWTATLDANIRDAIELARLAERDRGCDPSPGPP